MAKAKVKGTVERFLESMTPEERKKHDAGYIELIIEEMNIAAKERRDSQEISSGNIFADSGIPNPEECMAKAELILKISKFVNDDKNVLAGRCNISVKRAGDLLCGRLCKFTTDELEQHLQKLKTLRRMYKKIYN